MIHETILAIIIAFAISALLCPIIIPFLHKLKFGQQVRDDGPESHLKKQGTPTMGGLCFILGIVLALVLVLVGFRRYAPELMGTQQIQAVLLVMFLALGSGFIGFLDDFVKVVRHRNLGLVAWQKLVMQFAVTGGFLFGLNALGLLTTVITLPGGGALDLGLLYYPIAFFGIIFLVNAVNLTDGLDGLDSCVTFVSMLGYLVGASLLGFYHVSILATATAGACAGFLVWNFYPAKVFMGDTGSLFLGGAVCGMAFALDLPLILILVGIIYIVETLSDIIQIVYFKATHGKRIFRMAPLHHHLEMGGWSETKLFCVFSGATLLLCGLAFLGVMDRYPV